MRSEIKPFQKKKKKKISGFSNSADLQLNFHCGIGVKLNNNISFCLKISSPSWEQSSYMKILTLFPCSYIKVVMEEDYYPFLEHHPLKRTAFEVPASSETSVLWQPAQSTTRHISVLFLMEDIYHCWENITSKKNPMEVAKVQWRKFCLPWKSTIQLEQ